MKFVVIFSAVSICLATGGNATVKWLIYVAYSLLRKLAKTVQLECIAYLSEWVFSLFFLVAFTFNIATVELFGD